MRYVLTQLLGRPVIWDRFIKRFVNIPTYTLSDDLRWNDHLSRMEKVKVPIDASAYCRQMNKEWDAHRRTLPQVSRAA